MSVSFVSQVERFIFENELLNMHTTVVVGVSGGMDSMALLYYLQGIKERYHLQIIVAHIDHMFRGEQSAADMHHVIKVCEEFNLTCEAAQVNVSQYQKENGLGVQEAARECRYGHFAKVMEKYQADCLALAHHGDDQIETIMMRMVRGSISKGYAGIPVKRTFAGGIIIRPFLSVTKDDIKAYCADQGIIYRNDPSNEKDTYTRNRFRKYILPFLKQENPNVHVHLQRFSKFVEEDEKYLQELAFEKLNTVIKKKDKNRIVISIPAFESLPMPLQRRGIQLILNYLYEYQLPSSLSSIHIEQALSFLRRPHPSGSLDFPVGLKVMRSYTECEFYFFSEKPEEFFYNLPVPGKVVLPNGDEVTAEVSKLYPHTSDSSLFVGSYDAISTPLSVRTRKNGDRMTIKGMNGTKKIKAIFIEEKVPKQQRDSWPIVCDVQGEIIWIPLLKQSAWATSSTEHGHYILIRYNSKESSRRISK
ncbi:tRNA lysidine(34) synthetase TilS [Ectobacillus sp. JY-23]|uniref:tRNA lysidine(34) synthetase TilS n=1 Tax=Ectobacillus sp. JY-23 TaxID=2933872 RepID=UPI001FF57D3A|nr:tRNA lysidine(34) synthetase TilS [Ectobacillus sp. JY-23]UOY91432.1 tRNA lysidine(34) synthetase TilS [Ectobacillus sp. JY-23]